MQNQSKFIAELFNAGVLCDGSNDVEMLVQLAVTIGCSKSANGIGGMLRALESSGNSQLVSALQTWAKRDLKIKTDDDRGPNEPAAGTLAVQSAPRKKLCRNLTIPTELSVANQPKRSATVIFAATERGLISVNLQTLQVTALTSGVTSAVAVNHKLMKVYWAEMPCNSRIMRSNFDGSAKELIVPQAGDNIYTLAVDESSGNVYFALHFSPEIKVCDADGKNSAVVISNSSLVKEPIGIALDSENAVMNWSNFRSVQNSLVRANLDGGNAKIMSIGCSDPRGITLEQPLVDVLYWANREENTIKITDVNEGDTRTLIQLESNPQPWGIQVDAHRIYFSNDDSKSIQSVDRDSGKEYKTIFQSEGDVYHLALFNAPVTQS